MKCPHCEYEDGWNSDELKSVEGEYGEFFTFNFKCSRYIKPITYYGNDEEERELIGCPSCSKTFID